MMVYRSPRVRGGPNEESSYVKRHYRLAVVIALVGLSAAACANRNRGVQLANQTPDEFLVLARAPLVVPPDYALRPPMPGEPRPQDLNPEATARSALIGQRNTVANVGSAGERALMIKAKADEADPRIKEVIDDEQGDLAHKTEGFANWVMFWRKDQPQTQTRPTQGLSTALDAEAEARRLANLTGGQAIVIQRTGSEQRGNRGFKLPGL
jgi:hypothetical protein